MRRVRSSEQNFRVDKWSPGVRLPLNERCEFKLEAGAATPSI
jgi:hypothetical protein